MTPSSTAHNHDHTAEIMTRKHWQLDTDAQGIAWLTLDVADAETNVLSMEVLTELEALLGELAGDPPRGLVIGSGKPGGFIAGADVKSFATLGDRDQALDLIRRGQGVMDRIESLPCPTVAMIHGYCLGGGLEVALACNYRVALDAPQTRIGLPEVRLGIHPGFGGTVRSLRLLGPLKAMDLMLTGRSVDARTAKRMGLVDQAVPERQLRNAARQMLAAAPSLHGPGWLAALAGQRLVRPLIARRLRKQVAAKAPRRHYPAPYALIDLWEHHADAGRGMYEHEARSVAELITGRTARNLVRVFLLQTELKALGDKAAFTPRHVHVIGGGLMGGDIAAWCALQGLSVSVQDPNPEALARAVARAAKLYRRRFRGYPRLATAALDRLIPDPKGEGLRRADVVIEAVFEDLDVKRQLFRDIEPRVKPGALLATNTSSIPLEQIAAALADPGRLVGLHFFNPVARMPLLEIVRGGQTREEVSTQALAFARHIDKLPLPVTSSPGFLVNRVLTPYLLEAVTLEQEGVSMNLIDRAATDFGMPMGPLELADTVGLDVCLHVGEILARELGGEVPQRLRDLVEAGRLGKKSGRGFYRWKDGKPLREKDEGKGADLGEIQDRLILRYVNEAVACLREGVTQSADLVDAGMIFGTGFAPFRGGPLHYLHQHGKAQLKARLEALAGRHGDRFAPDVGWGA